MKTTKQKLWEFIQAVCTIKCGKCGREDISHFQDDYDAATDYYNAGWEVRNGKPVCSTCCEKIDKKKNK